MGDGQASSAASRPTIDVMFLCDEWKSAKGGLSTFNREFAINLAKTTSGSIKVHCYVSQSDELSKEDARKHGVNLITAQNIPGSGDPLDWLKIPPPELPNPDIVVGHGRKFGTVYRHFAPWSFRPQSFRPKQKSLRSIIEVTSLHTRVTSLHSEVTSLHVRN